MGAIRSSLVLNDCMSPALRRINNAMSLVLNNFEAVQRASGRSMNTANIAAAREEIGRANAALDQMEQNYRDCNNQQEELNNRITTGTSKAGGLMSKIKGIAATYLGMKTVTGLTGLSDTLTSNAARLELIVDDGSSVDALQQKIFNSAQAARASYTDVMATVAKLGLTAGEAFSNNDQLVKFTELINKNFVVGGASATEASSAMYQLTQALGSGRLQGDEYRSIIENAPLLAKSIEDYMRNVQHAEGTMKEWASEGKLTADVIKAAVFRSAEEVEERFNRMPMTWAQVWTSMKNRAIKALGPVLTKINELANNSKVQNTINGLINGFALIATVAGGAFEVICNIYTFMSDNWSWISPIIMGVVAALLIYKGVALAIAAVETITAFAKGIMTAATMLQTGGTFAATAAQTSFNAALWACPITWIIALIIALIVVFVIFTEQIVGAIWWLGALFKNIGLWIANVGIAAWQIIKNIGLWFANLGLSVWVVIKNTGLWFANLGLGIWSVLKACAGNVGTAFSNGWINIQIGFYTLLDCIMQGLKWLAEKANKYLGWMGVDIDTSGFDKYSNKIDELKEKKNEYTSISDAWADGFNTYAYDSVGDASNTFDYGSVSGAMGTFDTFQTGWGSDAYGKGSAIGAGISDWMGDNLSVDGIMKNMGVSDGSSYDSIGGGSTDTILGGIADDTGSMADSMGSSQEDLKYLRDIAERETVNRFTTAEVSVNFGGITQNVSSDTDLDGVVAYISDKVAEELEIVAEGVHE